MNIGIILYSETGNTYSVSQKLKEKLIKTGHSVNIERLKVIGKVNPGKKDIQFDSLPDIEPYDALVFGSPVQAFSLSSAMTAYLSQIKSLQDKKVAFLVTQFFPFPWLGGNRTIEQIKKSVNPREQLFAEKQSLTGLNLAVKNRLLTWLKN